jgi:CRP-like cAMP-binding protein
MKQKQLEKGAYLYKLDTNSSEMYIIQSGVVEITHFMKGSKDKEFLIERLYRGSIINHNSFLLNDGIDTNAKCKETVSIYYIDIETIKHLRQKYQEFDRALENQERILVKPGVREPALDYIICDPYSHQYFFKN